ncbi:hypothetical protein [Neosynechococcus sphagnicola]|uniref:hypothetical protein n=1 Tax=Neosynechococcus sphagnicola TaxID=1501145 RepID=UPI0005633A9F|nr:hypothetical protein [Neosynechococcus sphagnicola]
MLPNWLDHLGNWNPQLLRELKGRWTPRNLFLAIAFSLLIQTLILGLFYSHLPQAASWEPTLSNPFCTGAEEYEAFRCLLDASGQLLINWQGWWSEICNVLSWILPLVLLVGGVCLTIADLAQEQQRGTFNFLRLSPQSSQRIFQGKLWGVPSLLYLAVILSLPLHLIAAQRAGVPLALTIGFYAAVAACSGLVFSAGLLATLAADLPVWSGAIAVLLILLGAMVFGELGRSLDSWQWFYLPLGSHRAIALGLMLVAALVGNYWIWQALDRRYSNPSAPLLSKVQSYQLTACWEFFLLGFVIRSPGMSPDNSGFSETLSLLFFAHLGLFLLLILALSPHRQPLSDWARYRHEQAHVLPRQRPYRLLQDLVWGETSPAPLAIALNLLLAIVIWAPWLMFGLEDPTPRRMLMGGLLLTSNLILILAVLSQGLLLLKTSKRLVWAAATLGGLVILPPILLGMLSLYPTNAGTLWLLTAFPFPAWQHVARSTIVLEWLGQMVLLIWLLGQTTRQLHQLGASPLAARLPSYP